MALNGAETGLMSLNFFEVSDTLLESVVIRETGYFFLGQPIGAEIPVLFLASGIHFLRRVLLAGQSFGRSLSFINNLRSESFKMSLLRKLLFFLIFLSTRAT